MDNLGVARVLLDGAVGALQLVPRSQLGEGVSGDTVATHQPHRRVRVGGLEIEKEQLSGWKDLDYFSGLNTS